MSLGGPTGMPFTARLAPVQHVGMPAIHGSLLVSLEPILRTIRSVDPAISAVEVMDCGPHAAHFQLMVMARPEHAGDSRLALLSEMLPEVEPALIRERAERVRSALPESDAIAGYPCGS